MKSLWIGSCRRISPSFLSDTMDEHRSAVSFGLFKNINQRAQVVALDRTDISHTQLLKD